MSIRPLKGQVVIATTSPGKLKEYGRSSARLKELGGTLEFVPLPRKHSLLEIQGDNPQQIAAAKAWYAALKVSPTLGAGLYHLPIVTEDVLLAIPALGGLPGPYYADWHDQRKISNSQILRMMEGVEDRRVFATATLGYANPRDGKIFLYTGTCEGRLPLETRGSEEFGYDNMFEMDGLTFAEMTPEQKDAVSFRGRVMLAAMKGECTVHDWTDILPEYVRVLLPQLPRD